MDAIENRDQYRIIGLLDDYRAPGEIEDRYPILGNINNCAECSQKYNTSIFYIGIGDNWKRFLIYEKIKKLCPHAQFPYLVHPDASISNTVAIPDACVILPDAYIGRYANVGIGCLLGNQSCLGHDSSMGDFASIAPHAAIAGRTDIGTFSAVCMGAMVSHKLKIGEHSVIGAGSIVTKDIPNHVVAYGSPCIVRRSRNIGDGYL